MASANVGSSSARGRRRSLDAEINLVPFIDLLSMCICFLLMTAIWIEVGTIEMKQMLGTSAPEATPQSYDLMIQMREQNTMTVRIESQGKILADFEYKGEEFDRTLTQVSQGMGTFMATLDPSSPPDITARVLPHADYNYSQLVAVLDILRGNGIQRLGVVPVRM